MSERFTVSMLMIHGDTPRDRQTREQLVAALPDGAQADPPDELGVFDVHVDADDLEGALHTIWNVVAAAGADDHIVFLEHPELPQHWRHLSKPSGT